MLRIWFFCHVDISVVVTCVCCRECGNYALKRTPAIRNVQYVRESLITLPHKFGQPFQQGRPRLRPKKGDPTTHHSGSNLCEVGCRRAKMRSTSVLSNGQMWSGKAYHSFAVNSDEGFSAEILFAELPERC
mmetsp:Transcript_40693/g.63539  ORF Transcript_40693/g.63539 Transcript_40693/m.63539 type:complete len:131 (+) Transcript_40693:1502-1894(+)